MYKKKRRNKETPYGYTIMAKNMPTIRKGDVFMHYTGTIWRPPYEAASLLLEVTAGCTHHKCKFCTLYHDLPFKFRMSPLEDIESDLREVKRAMKGWNGGRTRRVFLTGANPFVLSYDKLTAIAELIRKYLPSIKSIGSFARITDVTPKTDEELVKLRDIGYDGLTIGIETGDDEALRFMNKGYTSADIIEQCQRLDAAGIHYSFFYLVSISGAGRGEIGAKLTADICNRIHPTLIGANMLTIYPDSELYAEIQRGNWQEEGELEKYKEVRTLIENLQIPTIFAAMGPMYGLYDARNKYYIAEQKLKYVLTSARSVTAHSEIQSFLIEKFGFRKAYCNLKIYYKPWLRLLINMAFPFRKYMPISPIKNLLAFEALNRGLN